MSPRLNIKNSPGASKKMSSIVLNQDTNYFTVDMWAWQPLIDNSGEIDNEGGVTVTAFQNVLNTTVKQDASVNFKIPLVTNKRFATSNGIIKAKLIGGGSKPLETQIKGNNTLSWLETIETLEVEFLGLYQPTDIIDQFSFEDIRENVVTDIDGNKVTRTKIFYVSDVKPITDSLKEGNPVTATRVTLTSGLTSLLQNPESGGLLEIDYLVEPVKPSNAEYCVVTYSSYMIHNSISGVDSSNGSPLNWQRVSKLNKDDLGSPNDYLVSDDMILDGVYPKTVVQDKVTLHSWMSGEIYNKFRIWEDIWDGEGSKGHFGRPNFCTNGKCTWDRGIPDREYNIFTAGTAPLEFSDEIKDLFKFDNERNGIKSWYNTFSFFDNVYTEVRFGSANVGEPEDSREWESSNGFFIFDVQKANVIDSQFGSGLQEGMLIQNPNVITNPNYSEEDYDNIINEASLGSVTINGVSFSSWDAEFSQIDKPDALYDWADTEENKKYIGITPGNDYIERMNKIISSGGKKGKDNDTLVKVGVTQIVDARQKFPTGDGSTFFAYPEEIFFSEEYCLNNGWKTNNKNVWKLSGEKEIQSITLQHWGGEKIKVEFFDSEGNPAVGIDQDGNKVTLPPTTIAAANQDSSGNPKKTVSILVFGFTVN